MKFEEYPWPIKKGHTPFKHQIETARFAIHNPRCFVLNDMGTGKTLSVLWASDILMINERIDKVLIVCPLSTMMSTWVKDIAFNLPHRKYSIVHGTRDRRVAALNADADFFIINHDGVKIIEDEILKAGFKLIILDELTAFKTATTGRSQSMMRITNKAKGVWGMTGEPTPNSPEEAYGQAKVVNPGNPYLPRYFAQYRNMVMERINMFIFIPKPGAEKVVNKVLQPAIRYKREDCVDLPPCLYETREIPLTAEQTVAYETMRKQLLVEHAAGQVSAANAAVKISKLLQIASGSVKDDEGNIVHYDVSPRLNELYDIYQNTPQHKLVVFAANRASVERVAEFLKTKNINVGIIYGSVSQMDRSNLISSFQGGTLNVLVIQPQAASHGITLSAANTVVWYSILPSNEVHNQANHRIIRIGQTRNQYIIYFIGCKAERRYLKILEDKQELSETTLALFEDILSP
jgi:SNF2 family DNA or RNA helicase